MGTDIVNSGSRAMYYISMSCCCCFQCILLQTRSPRECHGPWDDLWKTVAVCTVIWGSVHCAFSAALSLYWQSSAVWCSWYTRKRTWRNLFDFAWVFGYIPLHLLALYNHSDYDLNFISFSGMLILIAACLDINCVLVWSGAVTVLMPMCVYVAWLNGTRTAATHFSFLPFLLQAGQTWGVVFLTSLSTQLTIRSEHVISRAGQRAASTRLNSSVHLEHPSRGIISWMLTLEEWELQIMLWLRKRNHIHLLPAFVSAPYLGYIFVRAILLICLYGDSHAASMFSPSHVMLIMVLMVTVARLDFRDLVQKSMDQHRKHTTIQAALIIDKQLLQAELDVALHNYSPKVTVDAGTPADLLLALLTGLTEDPPRLPSLKDVIITQAAVLSGQDLYTPVGETINCALNALQNADQSAALMSTLGLHRAKSSGALGSHNLDSGSATEKGEADAPSDLHSVREALQMVLMEEQQPGRSTAGSGRLMNSWTASDFEAGVFGPPHTHTESEAGGRTRCKTNVDLVSRDSSAAGSLLPVKNPENSTPASTCSMASTVAMLASEPGLSAHVSSNLSLFSTFRPSVLIPEDMFTHHSPRAGGDAIFCPGTPLPRVSSGSSDKGCPTITIPDQYSQPLISTPESEDGISASISAHIKTVKQLDAEHPPPTCSSQPDGSEEGSGMTHPVGLATPLRGLGGVVKLGLTSHSEKLGQEMEGGLTRRHSCVAVQAPSALFLAKHLGHRLSYPVVPHSPGPVTRLRTVGSSLAAMANKARNVSIASGLSSSASPLVVSKPSRAMLDQVEQMLSRVDNNWHFDCFNLCEASQGRPLSTLCFYLVHTQGLIKSCNLDPVVFARFLRRIEDGYKPNPYHNKTHAAHVLHRVHVLLHAGGFVPGYVDSLTQLALYLAAAVHDYEHLGYTNDFLINTQDPLATLYNDRSPMENHHCAATFALLRQPGYGFMRMPKPDFDRLRKMLIDLVLATDMKQHFSIVTQFSNMHRSAPLRSASNLKQTPSLAGHSGEALQRQPGFKSVSFGEGLTHLPGLLRPGSFSSSQVLSCQPTPSSPSLEVKPSDLSFTLSNHKREAIQAEIYALHPTDENERMCSLQMVLKAADISNVGDSLELHNKWLVMLQEEFFLQGDAELTRGMPISPLFDRQKPGVASSQVGFMDVVAIPMYRALAGAFPGTQPLLLSVLGNHRYYMAVERAKAQLQDPVVPQASSG